MAEITKYYNVRYANRIDTPGNWIDVNPVLEPGELAFVGSGGNYYMILGDEHRTPIADIISNQEYHASHIFYPGTGGGGGGGGTGSIPIATSATIGGVKVPDVTESGLNLTDGGELTNALISHWDFATQRFVINKLHVNDLTYTNQSADIATSGDEIVLREGAINALADRSGIKVKFIQEGNVDGFLGIDPQNRIVIYDKGTPVSGYIISGQGDGYVTISEEFPYGLLTPFQELTFTDGQASYKYAPNLGIFKGEEVMASIDITPPAISVNGMPVTYDPTNRRYDIVLDGGLTPETAAKLNEFSNYIEIIDNLNSTIITEVEGDKHIEVTLNNQKLSTSHKGITVKRTGNINNYSVMTSSDPSLTSVEVITGLEVDDAGHLTGITTTTFTWTIK